MTKILERIASLAATSTAMRGERDLELWHKWKKTPTDSNASALLTQVSPIIHKEVNKWAGTLARPLLETEGKKLAMESFHSYDPTKGAALGTHVTNGLMKMSRLSYANQNVARLPENEMLKYHSYHVGHQSLQDTLGRAPTSDELADHLGWSIAHLESFRKNIGRGEMLESGGVEGSSAGLYEDAGHDHVVDFIHHGLPPAQKTMFEHLTGYGGAEILSNQEIQKKLGLTQGVYSYQKAKLVQHIEDVQNGRK
jgi:DNA-directed RNA polymerase specialized sigma subunit